MMTYTEIKKVKQKNVEIFHETMEYIRSGKSALSEEEMKRAVFLRENDIASLRKGGLFDVSPTESKTSYRVVDLGSTSAAISLHNSDRKEILVLNFASSTHPGGGVRGGARAQEETLCRQTTLLYSLESIAGKEFYLHHHDINSYLATDAMILSPLVQILRDDHYDWVDANDSGPLTVSVLTCAAPHLFPNTHDSPEFLSNLYYERILGMLSVAMHYDYRNLVLGAWGCGAFKNDPQLVADAFCRALMTIKNDIMCGKDFFEVVCFAVPDAESENHKVFKKHVEKMNEDLEKSILHTRQKSKLNTDFKVNLSDRIHIEYTNIVTANTDCIVNAANEHLKMGGGVCGAIFKAAGAAELTKACSAIGHCNTGSAVITDGYRLSAKYIIHAVGPRWNGGMHNEEQLLYSCYRTSLRTAVGNHCHSITFPLISAGIFGYPNEQAWKVAIQACLDYLQSIPKYRLDIYFAVIDESIKQLGEKALSDASARYIDENHTFFKQKEYCQKYIALLRVLFTDDELRAWCHSYDAFKPITEHEGLADFLGSKFMEDAYAADLVIPNYSDILKEGHVDSAQLLQPTDEFLVKLSEQQIIACISYHFRADHWNPGSLINDSIWSGALLKYYEALVC